MAVAATINGNGGNDIITGGSGSDFLNGVEGNDTITGNAGDDNISGVGGNDNISGGGGADNLTGNVGKDTLNGGSGADTLSGLAGTDFLIGGTGLDVFRFVAVGDSVLGVGRDVIGGFDDVGAVFGDRVNVNAIDANTAVAGNQNFAFISTAAFSVADQLRVVESGGSTIIQGNVDANLAADFETLVQDGAPLAANWVAGDFFL
ncbi:MAG: hypothetical protein H0X02_09600 [Nitrosomonas sp.]|nr:hypothetical protein [Nitrosomonas sp.]